MTGEKRAGKFWVVALLLCAILVLLAGKASAGSGLAMYGAPALPEDAPFPYVDPAAPQGGMLTQAVTGSFDSLNPFIVKGEPAVGVREFVYESLMKRSLDEPFSLYGLIADDVAMSADRTTVSFQLRRGTHFSDGAPLTSADVAFSLDLLKRKGRPNLRDYYGKVLRIEMPGPGRIIFHLDPAAHDRELPLILGLMPILPKHIWVGQEFDRTSLTPPIGSGAYRVAALEPGRRITYARDPNYWGKDLAVNRGFNNFASLRFDYYRDTVSAFEAFKTGLADLRNETDANRWASGYDFPALRQRLVARAELPNGAPSGMYGFAFNTRRPVFADPRVRRALILLFDFPLINRMLLHDAYARIESYFDHSDLAAKGPASAGERALLAPFPGTVTEEIMALGWHAPPGGSASAARTNRRAALELFRQAGYALKNGMLTRFSDGTPFSFEILLTDPSEERLALAYEDALKTAGITARIRSVDSAQYEMRRQAYDFDMTPFRWTGTLSPGNEQSYRWGSAVADLPGSYNVAGVKSAAADAMIAHILAATSREDMKDAVHALDRVLLSGAYVVPLFFQPYDRVAYRSTIGRPQREPLWGFDPLAAPLHWWRAATLHP
jgi:peptide/nickel transport system substrate-binding protein